MQNKAIKLISSVFAAIWAVIIFSEYWKYNPDYGKSIQFFQYYDLLILVIGLGFGIRWYLKRPKKVPIKYFNGLTIFLGMLFLDIIMVNRFCSKMNNLDFTTSGVFSHIAHIIGVVICLFLVYLVVRVMGELFTTIFPLKIANVDLPLINVSIGIMLFTFVLFFLGLIGLLNGFVLIPICLLILAFYWRQTFQIIKNTVITPIIIPEKISWIGIFSFLFLALFLAANFVQILRPFPIGSDSLRLYVNLPSLIAEYGGLVEGHQPYNWSLFMSTGLTIFGRMDVVLALSFFGGLLSLFALYRLSRKWLDVNYSALVLLLFYSLPMINFLSYMDMKIDMGLMFLSLCILLLFYNWAVPTKNENAPYSNKGIGLASAKAFFNKRIPQVFKQNHILVLMGLLVGFAFGIKLTVLFFFLSLFSIIWFFKGGKMAFMASFFLGFAAILLLKLDAQPGLRQFHDNVYLIQYSLLLIGIGLLVYLFIKQKKKLKELMTYSLIVGSFFVLPILPWMGKNYVETGKISVESLLNGKKASPIIKLGPPKKGFNKEEVIIPGLYQMPDVIKPTENKKKKEANNAVSVDLHRFMGYEVLPIRYLSLPYDVFIKTNISNFFIDIGFILLLLLPILFLFPSGNNFEWKSLITRLAFICLSILLLIIAIPSAILNQNNLSSTIDGLALMDSNEPSGLLSKISHWTNTTFLNIYTPINEWLLGLSAINSVTYPILILLFLIIISLVFIRIEKHTRITQSIILFLVMYFFLWWILGSGAAWYGILLFSIPYIFLFKTIYNEDEEGRILDLKSFKLGSVKKIVILGFSLIWVLLAFVQRTTNYTPIDEERAKRMYYPSVINYQMGNYNDRKIMDYHFPNVRRLVEPINRDKNSKVYMIGSPYSFFIDKNDRRVFSDTYLDLFTRLIQQNKTKDQVIAVLKAQGFKYIIFDLNMTSYDVTPGKTLTRKFIQFMNTLYMNPNVELMATDRKIKLYDSGEEVSDVFQDKGTIITSGSIGIFKIK